jgi:rhodanese-related sulfurtransferase
MKSTALSNVHASWDENSAAMAQASQQPVPPFCALEQDVTFAKSLVPLNALSDNHLRELLRNNDPLVVFRDQCLFEAGNYDHQFIYLLHGELELQYSDGRVETLVGGDQLKPIAHQQPRPCRALAKSDCSVLKVDAEYLDKMLTWSQVAEYLLLDISYQRDLDEDAEWMMTILRSNLFFKVPPTNISSIIDRMKSMTVETGDAILRQGEIGDNCYFIKQGEAEVRRSPDGLRPPEWVADIGPGRCFGEDALVNETVRNASVIMKTDGVLMYISKRDFLKLLKEPKVELLEAHELPNALADGTIFIDVRTEGEYADGHIEKAVNIPLNLLRIKTRLLDRDTAYVVYCDNGRRSKAAVHLLKQAKFKVIALNGGVRQLKSIGNLNLQVGIQDYVLREGKVVVGR